MRIILAHKYFFRGGGTATYLFALREQLHALGHETIPFTVAFERTEVDEYSEFYVSPPAGASQDHLKDIRMTPWTALKLLARSTWSVEAYYKARALVEATQPDIAYVHNLYTYMSPSPIAAFKDAGIPVVMRVSDYNMVCPGLRALRGGRSCLECIQRGCAHALRFRCHKDSLAATAARVVSMCAHRLSDIYSRVDLFVAPSRFMSEVLVAAGFDAGRVVHIPSFYAAPNGEAMGTGAGDHILYFGRLSPVKGLETLMRAHALLQDAPPLIIAGADTAGYAARLQKLAGELGTGVQLVGFKRDGELDDLIDRSLFTVVPSEWPDNSPMAVLESFAHGKPVIGARTGGVTEQVTQECGLLFEPGDVRGLAASMGTLLADPAARAQMGRQALARAREVYSPRRHCAQLLEQFRRVVS